MKSENLSNRRASLLTNDALALGGGCAFISHNPRCLSCHSLCTIIILSRLRVSKVSRSNGLHPPSGKTTSLPYRSERDRRAHSVHTGNDRLIRRIVKRIRGGKLQILNAKRVQGFCTSDCCRTSSMTFCIPSSIFH
jgi:hypothetical protein